MNPEHPGLEVVTTVAALRKAVAAHRRAGRTVGFVPTMGALHEGHASLVRLAKGGTDVVVASIFVNPLQFGPNEDLARYPRTPEADQRLLAANGCRLLFLPGVEDMYPDGFATRVELGGLTEVLCGKSRPGHFSGVLTVVLKLLNQVAPEIAYFGRKDFQQALVIRRMARDLDLPVKIEVCPIVREEDGLALSSRNRYLEAAERAQAPALRKAILAMDRAFRGGERDVAALLALGHATLARAPLFRLDYLELRDPETLVLRTKAEAGDLVAAAAWIGRARLIDNGLLGRE